MSTRAWLRLTLLVIAFGSIGVWAARGGSRSASTPTIDATEVARAKVLVTYFTTNVRCKTCRILEELSSRAVREGFPDEIARGEVAFRVVNTDQDENKAYIDHYSITNKIVIVSRQDQGIEIEWTPRQDIWLHYRKPDDFFTYVREPIVAYLRRS